jgi:hypothetical protein
MKRSFFFIALIISVISLFGGCKKKVVTYIVSGNVYDNTFSTNFSGLTLKIEAKKSGNAYYSLLTNVLTESNGNYSFTIQNDLYEKVRISAAPTNYFPIERIIAYGNLTQDANIYNLNTTAKAWARLIFNNNNPNPNDQLQYTKQDGKVGCSECCSADKQILSGAVNDTIFCINDGNTYYSYLYSVLGTSNNGINAVYTHAFDTTTLIFNY